MAQCLEHLSWDPEIPGPLVEFVPGSPWFNFSDALVKSQLVCLQSVGILNSCCCYSVLSFRWLRFISPENPNGELSVIYVCKTILYTICPFFHTGVVCESGWFNCSGRCVRIFDQYKQRSDANSYCQGFLTPSGDHGSLIKILSQDENNRVVAIRSLASKPQGTLKLRKYGMNAWWILTPWVSFVVWIFSFHHLSEK